MRIWKFLHLTGYLNTKNSFPISMFVLLTSGQCDLHIYFTFLQEFYRPQNQKYLISFRIINVSNPTNNFSSRKCQNKQLPNSSSLLQYYSFEQTCLHLTYVYLDYEISISSWHILNDGRTKMIALPLFQFTA